MLSSAEFGVHSLGRTASKNLPTDAERQALDALVDSWGPLTHEQRERLRPVLAGGIPRLTGCPCGCTSRPGYYTDPECVTRKPIGPPVDWAAHNGFDPELDVA